jgi:hypothetical protein
MRGCNPAFSRLSTAGLAVPSRISRNVIANPGRHRPRPPGADAQSSSGVKEMPAVSKHLSKSGLSADF